MKIVKEVVLTAKNPNNGKLHVWLDKDSFCPCVRVEAVLEVEMDSQQDGHITEEDMMQQFFESAMPMLEKIWEELHAS